MEPIRQFDFGFGVVHFERVPENLATALLAVDEEDAFFAAGDAVVVVEQFVVVGMA